jgi:pimeloyl-ACP methyl ester carboxylesterase
MDAHKDAHKDLKKRAQIRPEERDRKLQLQTKDWGKNLQRTWRREHEPKRHFTRTIPVHGKGASTTYLEEAIVPFPSAPIYGTNRKAEYGMSLARPNMHSLRVLRRPGVKRIDRVFLLHNGLNESDRLNFYYRLADWILQEQEQEGEGAACLIMPFPGHLMHFAYHGQFSETPLSRYLTDAGDLFRQFLRYMVGMRWLLGIITDARPEDWMVGGDLPGPGRVAIGTEIYKEASKLFERSQERIKRTQTMLAKQVPPEDRQEMATGKAIEKDQVSDCIEILRHALLRDQKDRPRALPTHVVGYSLGGFVAQSVFFAWPQLVSSCTTICSGGAIDALSPTAFAHPEEWQAVLHALRPEINNSMLQGRLADEERGPEDPVNSVAGLPLERFGYFHRIFEHVFLQGDRGSYKERLSEYGSRMLFVSGGEDPIVRPTNILDASPEEGITMLSVASMTHFLAQDPKSERQREKEQRDFWLPEAGKLIGRAAIRAERVHKDERTAARAIKEIPIPESSSAKRESDHLESSEDFESALDWVLDVVDEKEGCLLVCRNSLPPAFLKPEHFGFWATALHHHDLRVQEYAGGLRRRADKLDQLRERTTLIVPKLLRHWFVDLTARFDPHSDSPSGRFTLAEDRVEMWKGFERKWWECTRNFEAGALDEMIQEEVEGELLAARAADWLKTTREFLEVTNLPDVWIGIDSKILGSSARSRNLLQSNLVGGVCSILEDDKAQQAEERDLESRGKGNKPEPTALEKDLEDKKIRIVYVSGADSNPRYRGYIERDPRAATRLLAHAATALVRSRPMPEPPAEEDAEPTTAS